MIDRWRKLLLCLGITPNYKGFHFLLTCLELLQSDPMALLQVTKSLYPVVAKHHNTSWRTVERDLRTVVNLSKITVLCEVNNACSLTLME